MPSPVRSLFNRIDRSGNGSINRSEAETFAKDAKVNTGWFAGKKLKGAVDQMMSTFDGNKNGQISWAEFSGKASKMLPPGLDIDPVKARANPGLVDQKVKNYLQLLDSNRDGKLNQKELARQFEKGLRASGAKHAGTKATIGAQIATHGLGGSDKQIDARELSAFARSALGIGS